MKKALTLDAAIDAFDPGPLPFDEGRPAFYVDRPDDPLGGLRVLLTKSSGHASYLLTGHCGSGKSTELNRLAADPEIRRRFEIVAFSVQDVLDLNQVGHIELLIACVAGTLRQLDSLDETLKLPEDTLRRLEGWKNSVTETLSEDAHGSEAEAGVGLNTGLLSLFFVKLSGRLKVEHSTRTKVREVLDPRFSEFLSTLKSLFQDVGQALWKARSRRLLLIVEDLDKIPLADSAEKLFMEAGGYLAQLPCTAIYTHPIALRYSKHATQITGPFRQQYFVPAIAIREPDGTTGTEEARRGRKTLQDALLARLDAELISEAALDLAVERSGGMFQQLQRLLENSVVEAVATGGAGVDVAEIEAGCRVLRSQLEPMLRDDDLPILDRVARTHEASSDPATQDLLHSLHLLEYNGQRWCDMNPLLRPILERWRERQDAGENP